MVHMVSAMITAVTVLFCHSQKFTVHHSYYALGIHMNM